MPDRLEKMPWRCRRFGHKTFNYEAGAVVVGTSDCVRCGHPNHGNADHDCAPFRPLTTPGSDQ